MAEPEVDHSPAGSRNEATRRHNLSTLLRYVHHHGDTSRADLTRITGLNRSTVGVLVGELVALGLVKEREPHWEEPRAGRPSPMVHADADVVALGINPETDGVRMGVIGLGGVVHELQQRSVDSPPTLPTMMSLVRDMVASSAALVGRRLVCAGVAVPGLVDEHSQVVAVSHHLGWRNVAVAAALEDALGVPAAAANDANVGAVAEALFGAGRGERNLVYLNGSASGVGAGVIMEGRLLRGERSFAGELGHLTVSPGGAACGCGRRGCLEAYVSMARMRAASGRPDLALDDLDALFADPALPVLRELERQTERLAQGIATIVTILAPRRVVLGGLPGAILTARGEELVARVGALAMPDLALDVPIVRNELREHMMSVGAAEVAFSGLLEDPAGALSALAGVGLSHRGSVSRATARQV
ncbi:ROK family transcriptional regulator [Demequina capsici]|uniref:ROK family transcriptional regulator n=1 Tax=Demequina capsici TaxID=3075620 RepID=A0AA96JD37_9MICO|nr:ROK family transcriptional regulator [Demequina sp. OYTSA14]WNM24269.1 ROK family transcriptional regulator [Demequina sp. OYTSA14]